MIHKTVAPGQVDAHIGQRVQLRRNMMGMSQKDLAQICGVTFQQIQKYETAGNRISASRLFELSVALATPISFFFVGLPGFVEERRTRYGRLCDSFEDFDNFDNDSPMNINKSLELISLYWGLENDTQRQLIIQLLKQLNESDNTEQTQETP